MFVRQQLVVHLLDDIGHLLDDIGLEERSLRFKATICFSHRDDYLISCLRTEQNQVRSLSRGGDRAILVLAFA